MIEISQQWQGTIMFRGPFQNFHMIILLAHIQIQSSMDTYVHVTTSKCQNIRFVQWLHKFLHPKNFCCDLTTTLDISDNPTSCVVTYFLLALLTSDARSFVSYFATYMNVF